MASVKTGFASAVRLADLDVSTGNVTPHTLRHTAATWLMQRGAAMWDAAGFLGMSEKTLRETYGYHHPEFLRGAAHAIASRPAPAKEALVISLVEEKAKGTAPRKPMKLLVRPAGLEPATRPVSAGCRGFVAPKAFPDDI
nr:tyrosine-type recombinase/integrase [Bradyrhizobium roseus]